MSDLFLSFERCLLGELIRLTSTLISPRSCTVLQLMRHLALSPISFTLNPGSELTKNRKRFFSSVTVITGIKLIKNGTYLDVSPIDEDRRRRGELIKFYNL